MKFDHVTPEWVKNKLKEHRMKQKDLVEAIDTDKYTVSRWVTGSFPIGSMAKAAIHYYFENLERTQ
jgi:transcriptional regulator with XRE-family HTH domain